MVAYTLPVTKTNTVIRVVRAKLRFFNKARSLLAKIAYHWRGMRRGAIQFLYIK